jgi:hypothetical protein
VPYPTVIGCDFTSSPSRVKPITVALAKLLKKGRGFVLEFFALERFDTLSSFESFLGGNSRILTTPWVGGFDLPFGLPRSLVEEIGWPKTWLECMQHYTSLERPSIRATFKAYCDARPPGSKFAHRSTDLIAKSSPSMKWVNPPVAYMLHAGVPILMRAGLSLPGICAGDDKRVALEAYPGLLARQIVAHQSYKSDDKNKHTSDRLLARERIVQALISGAHQNMGRSIIGQELYKLFVQDPSADSLDAALCTVQAAAA